MHHSMVNEREGERDLNWGQKNVVGHRTSVVFSTKHGSSAQSHINSSNTINFPGGDKLAERCRHLLHAYLTLTVLWETYAGAAALCILCTHPMNARQ